MRPDVTAAKWPLTEIYVIKHPLDTNLTFLYLCYSKGATAMKHWVDFFGDKQHSCSNLNYLSVLRRAYLLRVFPFLLIFLLQEVADDLKEVLWRWWKGKYVTHPRRSITGTAARCFLKSWHINTMHSKRTVMDNKLTFLKGFLSGNNDGFCGAQLHQEIWHWNHDGFTREKMEFVHQFWQKYTSNLLQLAANT